MAAVLAPPLLVIGAGRLGLHVSWHLARSGRFSVDLWNRRRLRGVRREWADDCVALGVRLYEGSPLDAIVPRASRLLLALPDDVLAVSGEVIQPELLAPDAVVLHASGSRTSAVLEALAGDGRGLGVMHPLQSLTGAPGESTLEGVYFGVEGDDRAVGVAEEIVRALKGKIVRIASERKVLYHAAAVMASNLTVVLSAMAARLMVEALGEGDDANRGLEMLLPLIQGTVGNLERIGLPDALTGPLSRGDVETIRAHLEALSLWDGQGAPMGEGADIFSAYRLLSRFGLNVAREQGVSEGEVEAMARVLSAAPPWHNDRGE